MVRILFAAGLIFFKIGLSSAQSVYVYGLQGEVRVGSKNIALFENIATGERMLAAAGAHAHFFLNAFGTIILSEKSDLLIQVEPKGCHFFLYAGAIRLIRSEQSNLKCTLETPVFRPHELSSQKFDLALSFFSFAVGARLEVFSGSFAYLTQDLNQRPTPLPPGGRGLVYMPNALKPVVELRHSKLVQLWHTPSVRYDRVGYKGAISLQEERDWKGRLKEDQTRQLFERVRTGENVTLQGALDDAFHRSLFHTSTSNF